jgi:hypothetical protein
MSPSRNRDPLVPLTYVLVILGIALVIISAIALGLMLND